jgi:hypothetical protein
MIQKRIFIFSLMLALVGIVPQSMAQKGKSEISGSYGLYSFSTLDNGKPYSTSSGVGLLSYKYYLTKRFTFGMGMGYENISNSGSYLTFTPEFTYTYYDNNQARVRVKFYGGASIGMSVFEDFYRYSDPFAVRRDDSGPKLAGHIMPFGVRIGRKLGYYAEFGLGYKGVINTGFAYRFKTKRNLHVEN